MDKAIFQFPDLWGRMICSKGFKKKLQLFLNAYCSAATLATIMVRISFLSQQNLQYKMVLTNLVG